MTTNLHDKMLKAIDAYLDGTVEEEVAERLLLDVRDEINKQKLAEQDGSWCMKMNGCKTKCEDCPDEVAEQPAQQEPTIYVDPDAIRILLDPDHSGVVTAQLTRHKPDPLRGPKVGLCITKENTK